MTFGLARVLLSSDFSAFGFLTLYNSRILWVPLTFLFPLSLFLHTSLLLLLVLLAWSVPSHPYYTLLPPSRIWLHTHSLLYLIPIMAKTFTKGDVASHNKADNLWVVIDDDVYDLTKFQDEHPGACLTPAKEAL